MQYLAPNPTKIFHMTCIDNLRNILISKEISSKNKLDQNKYQYQNIAYEDVQNKRAKTIVPIFPHGSLHDYVPFYFAPRSPMLSAIYKNKVLGYDKGQENLCYIISEIEKINQQKVAYVFTTGHPIMQPQEFFASISEIHRIDWEIFQEHPLIGGYSKYFHDKNDNPKKPKWIDRRRKRQAEFLVYQELHWDLVTEVATINEENARIVREIFTNFLVKTPIIVNKEWFF